MKLPSNMEKRKIYRDKTIDELLCMEIPESDRRANRTIKKLIGRVGTLFTYAIDEEIYDGNNPALRLILPKSKDDEDMRRSPFDKDDLIKLFHSKEYLNDKHKYPYMFWSPIIALFHGMRLNEIAQLHLSDIKRSEGGVLVFEVIENREDKSVKTTAGKRLVPIHPFIIKELNFLRFYRDVKSKGVERLFHELQKGKKGYGARISKWFNARYRKRCGIVPPEDGRMKVFHSFRTTFITDLRHKKVHDMMLKQVVGHKIDSSVTGDYTDKFPPQQLLQEIIVMIDFEKQIDLSHLKHSKYVLG
jgi:integrase